MLISLTPDTAYGYPVCHWTPMVSSRLAASPMYGTERDSSRLELINTFPLYRGKFSRP